MTQQSAREDLTAGNALALVTGGAGFIGVAIAPALADAFDRVVVVDNLHPQIHPTAQRPGTLDPRVELVVGDVTEEALWERVLRDAAPDIVVHLAAETGTGQSLAEASRHAMVNVVGTTRMLDALLAHDRLPRRLVLASSRAVYGEGAWRDDPTGDVFYPGQRADAMLERGEWDFPGAEPMAMSAGVVEPAPVSIYGATKLAQEHLISAWAQSLGVEHVIVRLQNVYGPGQSLINPYTGIMSLFCRLAKAGRSIPLYEDGQMRRDFVLIDDAARAVMAATLAQAPGTTPVDIGSGEYQTIARAAGLIAARYGAPEPHVSGEYRQGDVRHAWADVSRAERQLGWTPQVALECGVERLASWIDDQPGSELDE